MIRGAYDAGYNAREKEQDYDPMRAPAVCAAVEKWDRLHALARQVADGNFNQAEIIKEAKLLAKE